LAVVFQYGNRALLSVLPLVDLDAALAISGTQPIQPFAQHTAPAFACSSSLPSPAADRFVLITPECRIGELVMGNSQAPSSLTAEQRGCQHPDRGDSGYQYTNKPQAQ
jgi:hypothetical protein